MIKRISENLFHQSYVSKFIDHIQKKGYVVTEVKEIKKRWLCGIFGDNVTEIHYSEKVE